MYLDPGFGSMLIQMLIAGIAAAGVMLGVFRHRIALFFSRRKSSGDKEVNNTDKSDMVDIDCCDTADDHDVANSCGDDNNSENSSKR